MGYFRFWGLKTEVKEYFSRIYNKGIFVKLQNPEYFRNFTLDGWTVDWNNEIGFAPEYLHEQGLPLALACNGMEKKCNW